MRIWITRTQPGADRQGADLSGAGYEVVVAPVMTIEATGMPEPVADYSHVVFLSEQAVLHGGSLDYCAGAEVYAVGERTAALLRERGLTVCTPTQASSDGLVALFDALEVRDARVLIVAGEGGRRLLAETLAARGAAVEELLCYRRRFVSEPPPDLASIDTILVASQDGFRQAARVWFDNGGPATVRVFAASQRIAELGATLGFQDVRVTGGAASADWLVALAGGRSDA